ncbi:MAG: hypothetical protein Q8R24_04835 [Legionellaceae bacterium]|nr:hypothetical protein [Legionellaceae bacterium]
MKPQVNSVARSVSFFNSLTQGIEVPKAVPLNTSDIKKMYYIYNPYAELSDTEDVLDECEYELISDIAHKLKVLEVEQDHAITAAISTYMMSDERGAYLQELTKTYKQNIQDQLNQGLVEARAREAYGTISALFIYGAKVVAKEKLSKQEPALIDSSRSLEDAVAAKTQNSERQRMLHATNAYPGFWKPKWLRCEDRDTASINHCQTKSVNTKLT